MVEIKLIYFSKDIFNYHLKIIVMNKSVVIMAGGQGTRIKEKFSDIPKVTYSNKK